MTRILIEMAEMAALLVELSARLMAVAIGTLGECWIGQPPRYGRLSDLLHDCDAPDRILVREIVKPEQLSDEQWEEVLEEFGDSALAVATGSVIWTTVDGELKHHHVMDMDYDVADELGDMINSLVNEAGESWLPGGADGWKGTNDDEGTYGPEPDFWKNAT